MTQIDQIKAAVAEHFGIGPEDLRDPSRVARVTLARHLAMYFCRRRTALSLGEIAAAFNRKDHGTVIHACQRVERQKYEPEVAEAIRQITGRLDGYFVSSGGSVFASFTAPGWSMNL